MKKLLILAMSAMMTLSMAGAAFAAESPATTPVKLTTKATAIDITVSEAVEINAEANTVTATVTDYTVTNNNAVSFIKVDKIELKDGAAGWAKAAYDEAAFKALAANSNKYALQAKVGAGEAHDMNADWATVGNINHDETMTVKLSGLVTPVTTAVNATEIASLIVTVSA